MSEIKILHNPRCSKSRQTLQLLQDKGYQPEIIEYLKTPPSVDELSSLFAMLGLSSPREMMRVKESEYKEQNLADTGLDNQTLFEAMHGTPKLIERPIVVTGGKAKIGRPPEQVLELFE